MSFSRRKLIRKGQVAKTVSFRLAPAKDIVPSSGEFRGSPAISMKRLRSIQHSQSQEVKVRAPVHLPFEHLQAIDMTFGLAIAPFARECRAHCRLIGQQTLCKTF